MGNRKKPLWFLTQQQIAAGTGLSQPYVHLILKGDRMPTETVADKLEGATGVCREAWIWPDRHWNPYIPVTAIAGNCLSCHNRMFRTKFMWTRFLMELSKMDPRIRLDNLTPMMAEVHFALGFPANVKFVFGFIRDAGLYVHTVIGDAGIQPPYLMPDWVVPWSHAQLRQGGIIEVKYVSEIPSDIDQQWYRERKVITALLVSSKRLMFIISSELGGPIYYYPQEMPGFAQRTLQRIEDLLRESYGFKALIDGNLQNRGT